MKQLRNVDWKRGHKWKAKLQAFRDSMIGQFADPAAASQFWFRIRRWISLEVIDEKISRFSYGWYFLKTKQLSFSVTSSFSSFFSSPSFSYLLLFFFFAFSIFLVIAVFVFFEIELTVCVCVWRQCCCTAFSIGRKATRGEICIDIVKVSVHSDDYLKAMLAHGS